MSTSSLLSSLFAQCRVNVTLFYSSVKRETSKTTQVETWIIEQLSLLELSQPKARFVYPWISLLFFSQMITGGIEMEGVYRVNGGQLTMKKLKTAFDQGNVMELWLFIRGHDMFSLFISDLVSTEFRKTECKSISSPSERKNKTSELLETWHQARSGNTWAVFYPQLGKKSGASFFNQSQSICNSASTFYTVWITDWHVSYFRC